MIDLPELRHLFAGADHVDDKSVDSDVPLREFVAGALAWNPGWRTALFAARGVLAKLLGLQHNPGSTNPRPRPADIPFTPGAEIGFWTVTEAVEDRFLVLEASDTHLSAHLVLAAEPGRRHAITVVHYRKWTGPVYFTIILPFHHLVVRSMVRAGARA